MLMLKTKDFTGMLDENILFEQLLPSEPATITRKVSIELKTPHYSMFNIECSAKIGISDNMEQFCKYVYIHDYAENSDCRLDYSSIRFIDLKAPVGDNICFVILRTSKSICNKTGKIYIYISICYIKNRNTNLRLLQYNYNKQVIDIIKLY